MSDRRILKVTNQGEVRLYEDEDNGFSYVSLSAPASLAGVVDLALPSALPADSPLLLTLDDSGAFATVPDGTAGQALITDGDGNFTWQTVNAVGVFDLQFGYDNGPEIEVDDGVPVLISAATDTTSLQLTFDVEQTVPGLLMELSGGVGLGVTGADYPIVTDDGVVLLGADAPLDAAALAVGDAVLAAVRSGTDPAALLVKQGDTADPAKLTFLKTRSVDTSADTPVEDGDVLAHLSIFGADGTDFIEASKIEAIVDDTVVTGSVASSLVFSTLSPGSALLDSPMSAYNFEANGADFFGNAALDLAESSTPTYAAGKVGNAVQIGGFGGSGASSSLSSADNDLAAFGAGDRSFAVWFKGASFANDPAIISNWAVLSGTNVQWLLWVEGGTLKFQVRDTGNVDHSINVGSVSTDTWYFVVITWDLAGLEFTLRLDAGVTQTGTTPSITTTNPTDHLGAGTRNNGTVLNGALDALITFDRVLSEDEKDALYNSGNGRQPPFAFPSGLTARLTLTSAGAANIIVSDDVLISDGPLGFDNSSENDVNGSGDSWHVTFDGNALFEDVMCNDITADTITGTGWSFDADGDATMKSITSTDWEIQADGDATLNSVTSDNWSISSAGAVAFASSLVTGKSELGGLVLTSGGTKTIAAGVITINQSAARYVVEGEGAANDDLDTISGGVDGQILILQAFDDTHTITVTENGNIVLNGASHTLDSVEDIILLMFRTGTNKWVEINFSSNT